MKLYQNNMNSKIIQALHSRTLGVLVIMIAYNILAVYGKALDPQLSALIDLVLGGLVSYLHINPAVQGQYTPAGITPPITPMVVDTTTENVVPSTPTPPQA